MIGAINALARADLIGRTYVDVLEKNGLESVIGGTAGNVILNPVYEFSYKMSRNGNAINVYARTGEDNDQDTEGLGGMVVRTFDLPTRTMRNDRIEFYYDSDWAVFEYLLWPRENDVWIYTRERRRGEPPTNEHSRCCLLKSTDGLIGREFAPAIVQVNAGPHVNPSNVIDGSADGTVKYLMSSSGSPRAIRRYTISEDGTLSAPTVLLTAADISECSFLNVDRSGTVLGIVRVNTGDHVLQTVSTDWGATFGPLVNTGMGAATGAKVTPKLTFAANRGDCLTLTFNDRGAGNRDCYSAMTRIADAVNNTWEPVGFIGTPATQGNCAHIVIDPDKEEYLYCTAQQTGTPVVTRLIWWTLRNRYSRRSKWVAPWK